MEGHNLESCSDTEEMASFTEQALEQLLEKQADRSAQKTGDRIKEGILEQMREIADSAAEKAAKRACSELEKKMRDEMDDKLSRVPVPRPGYASSSFSTTGSEPSAAITAQVEVKGWVNWEAVKSGASTLEDVSIMRGEANGLVQTLVSAIDESSRELIDLKSTEEELARRDRQSAIYTKIVIKLKPGSSRSDSWRIQKLMQAHSTSSGMQVHGRPVIISIPSSESFKPLAKQGGNFWAITEANQIPKASVHLEYNAKLFRINARISGAREGQQAPSVRLVAKFEDGKWLALDAWAEICPNSSKEALQQALDRD